MVTVVVVVTVDPAVDGDAAGSTTAATATGACA